MADGILTPCNVACGSGIVTVKSPSGSTLQCGRWLWDDMPLNSPKRPPYWNSTSGFDFDHIIAFDMSFCTSLRNFIKIGPPSVENKWRHVDFQDSISQPSRDPIKGSLKSPIITTNYIALFSRKSRFWHQHPRWRISAILDFRGPIMGSLKSPDTTSYRSSIDTVALNCLVFEKIPFFAFWRQTNKQTDEQMDSTDALIRSRCRERWVSKIWRTMIFNMPDRILTPCNVARSWHWFRQVTAPWLSNANANTMCHVALGSWLWIHEVAVRLPCNVTRGSGMTCH